MLDMFRSDTRVAEGLLVCLVVALVVGVTSTSTTLNMLSGVQGLATLELDVKLMPDVVGPGEQALDFTVTDHEGNLVGGVTVIMKSGTVEINDVTTVKSDDGGSATVNIDAELGVNRENGTLVVDVEPPTGGSFVDRRESTSMLVVQG